MFGRSAAETIGRPLSVLIPPRFRQVHRQHVHRFAETGETLRAMGRVTPITALRRDGSDFPAEASISQAQVAGKKILTVILRDISERVHTEQVQQQAESQREAALASVTQLAAIVESSDDAIVGKTLDGTITSWNAGAERIYGYTADEAKGRNVSILVPPDRQDELRMILVKIQSGECVHRYETMRVRKDGQEIHASITVSPIRDSAGRITGASTIARDISDR